MTRASLLAAFLFAASLHGAAAATVTETYAFSLSNFTPYEGSDPPPSARIAGSATVTFDPTISRADVTGGITLNFLSGASLGSPASFTSYRTNDGRELLYIGGVQNGAGEIASATNDFVLALDVTAPNAPKLLRCSDPYESCDAAAGSVYGSAYTVSGRDGVYGAQTANVRAVPNAVTETYDFSLSNFTNYVGSDPSPASRVSGSATVTFDPSSTQFDVTSGIALNSLVGATLGSAVSYTSYRTNDGRELLYIGGLQSGATNLESATDDVVLALDVTSPSAPVLLLCSDPYESCGSAAGSVYGSGYATMALDDSYGAQAASVEAVPEPASFALLGVTAGAAAILRRRREID